MVYIKTPNKVFCLTAGCFYVDEENFIKQYSIEFNDKNYEVYEICSEKLSSANKRKIIPYHPSIVQNLTNGEASLLPTYDEVSDPNLLKLLKSTL